MVKRFVLALAALVLLFGVVVPAWHRPGASAASGNALVLVTGLPKHIMCDPLDREGQPFLLAGLRWCE